MISGKGKPTPPVILMTSPMIAGPAPSARMIAATTSSTWVMSVSPPLPKSGRGLARATRKSRGKSAVSRYVIRALKAAGLLTRDSRKVERKKYGLKKARRAPQFSKR